MKSQPEKFDYIAYGSYYKIGSHGFLYMWTNGEWRRSQALLSDIKSIDKKRMLKAR